MAINTVVGYYIWWLNILNAVVGKTLFGAKMSITATKITMTTMSMILFENLRKYRRRYYAFTCDSERSSENYRVFSDRVGNDLMNSSNLLCRCSSCRPLQF